ncbi:MAG: 30S ribosomal protein S15 [Oligoflexales bacterium]|nr:30S ribosomal protein S15 [Oligoflexales bacterium]
MGLSTTEKQELIKKFGKHPSDTASPEIQVALITARLNQLRGHFDNHKKDHHSRRGLLKLVGKRKKLLTYLSSQNYDAYKTIIAELGIRK